MQITLPDNRLVEAIQSHWPVEIAAVLLFLLLYEVALKKLVSFLVNKWQARKHDISGKYLAFFDDQQQGRTVRQYSNLAIKQRGTKITGKNVLASGGSTRTWILRGKLIRGYLLAGTYEESSYRDSRSIGTFFVRQLQGTLDFQGYWSGFDEVNSRMAHGDYEFKHRPKLRMESARRADGPRIAKLSEEAFGQNYLDVGIEPNLKAYMPSARMHVARTGKDKSIIGFSLCYMLPKDGLCRFLNIEGEAASCIDTTLVSEQISGELHESDRNGQIGVIQTLCVSEEARHRGVGRDLFETAQAYLRTFSPGILLAPAWNISGHLSAAELLRSFGFEDCLRVPNYWKKECDEKKFKCPSRGTHCGCEMSLFLKTV
ncbi:MAG: hypothetical protein QOG66_657 [Methylobacteriaceae bacterium]|jgi:ribosomal protein S18 acetylase RimI-like enzyme|nr:hypothetical protein [Methylobacteriaceae bacterium]